MKTKIIKIFILLFVAITFTLNTSAQNSLDSLNSQLRNLFVNLARPSPALNFNWDMSAHVIDSNYFELRNHIDTLSPYLFGTMYDDMRTSAYDTTVIEPQDSIEKRARYSGRDTLNMLIMDYAYYRFLPDALTTNTYFDFDTINDILTDKAVRPGFPYYNKEVFIASPAYTTFGGSRIMYHVSPQLIFKDANSLIKPNMTDTLKINFNDGNGWYTIDPFNENYFSVNYTTAGKHTIEVKIIDMGADEKAYSVSNVNVKRVRGASDIPNDYFPAKGMTVGIYPPCVNSNSTKRKALIYLEGFDPMDIIPSQDRGVEEIYETQIRNTGLGDLRNFGYEIYVVDWDNSRIDMKKNADNLISFLRDLKCVYANEPTGPNEEEFVIIGESMGGLIANYALTLMESGKTDNGDCFKEKMHNTRLLITLDSPHKGAHVPMSIQLLYEKILAQLPDRYIKKNTGASLMFGNLAFDYYNLLLNSKSAKQMLREHYETESFLTPYTYTKHDARKKFLDDLQSIGNQPKYCKLIAMSNGNLDAQPQTRYWDGQARTPNDNLFKYTNVSSIKVLGTVIPLAGWNFELRTNPNNSNDPLDRLEFGSYWYKLKIRLFKIKLYWGPNSLLAIYREGNLEPTSTSSGSALEYNSDILDGLSYFNNLHYTGSNGLWAGNGQSFLWGAGNSLTTYQTDGFHWCFVPTASALNWTTDLNVNFNTMPLSTLINNMKYDVSMGILPSILPFSPTNFPIFQNCYINNMHHLYVRRDNLTFTNGSVINYVYSCTPTTPNSVKILNREIGDNILNIDNRKLPWQASFSSYDTINVNENSPYYSYLGVTPSPNQLLDGIYSKSNPFDNSTAPPCLFYVNNANLNYLPPMLGAHGLVNTNYQTCCLDYFHKKQFDIPKGIIKQFNNCTVFPNPFNSTITIQFKAVEDKNTTLEIYNIQGKLVYTNSFNVSNNYTLFSKTIELPSTIIAGTYILKLKNGLQIFNNKINKN